MDASYRTLRVLVAVALCLLILYVYRYGDDTSSYGLSIDRSISILTQSVKTTKLKSTSLASPAPTRGGRNLTSADRLLSLSTTFSTRNTTPISQCTEALQRAKAINTYPYKNSTDGCYCDGENLCFPAGSRQWGKAFDCQWMSYLRMFNLLGNGKKSTNKDRKPTFRHEDVAFVTYSSSNHFAESQRALKTLRSVTNNTVVYYDIGLKANEIALLKNMSNLEYRRLPFEIYPKHVSRLLSYHFKAIIAAEMYSNEQYPAYWIIDSSIMFHSADKLKKFQEQAAKSQLSLIMNVPTSHSILFATHPDMYKYLPIEKESSVTDMWSEGIQFHMRSSFTREVIKWHLLCALQENCMNADKGKERECKLIKCDRINSYGKCHRYCQSAMSIIHYTMINRNRIVMETVPKMTEVLSIKRG